MEAGETWGKGVAAHHGSLTKGTLVTGQRRGCYDRYGVRKVVGRVEDGASSGLSTPAEPRPH